jgi:DNA-directed RNA polymerase subunit RPC12/RpoP
LSDSARELLVRGIAAAKAGDVEEARFFLEWVLRADADHAQIVSAWYYLSQITSEPAAKRECLENVLAREPTHPEARRSLAVLDGRLDPAAIIDPNRPPDSPGPTQPPPSPRRFVCSQCGGKLAFSPDGQQLICAYCNTRMTLYQAFESGALVEEHDFTVALATAKGHTQPVASQSMTCRGCGASFLLAPHALSLTCPYCASPYVVEVTETCAIVPPAAVIPFQINRDQASAALRTWASQQRLRDGAGPDEPLGAYVPAWTFDIGGAVQWRGAVLERYGGRVTKSPSNGSYPVFYNDILVPASHTLPASIAAELHNYDLTSLVPYDPAFLVDWPAEIYQITVADASLVARRQVWEDAREMVTTRLSVELERVENLSLSSAGLMIESYKLILLPLWVAHCPHNGESPTVVVNGQNGAVRDDRVRGGLRGFLERLL